MALTGDLAKLHITDIIQLIHTTRQSGTFSVKGSKGESRIIFSNGYMVGANHLNSRIRIGSVLVAMKAISAQDLKIALDYQKEAGSNRRPLISTLKQMGKLKDDAAFRALKKLIEITVVELVDWKEGTFTFDSDAITVSAECTYHPGEMEQEQSLDAQMVLMDALRVYDERERDRMSGAGAPSDEELYAEVLPSESVPEPSAEGPVITADILGLAEIEQLENRIPVKVLVTEAFDPVAIHRKKIREVMHDFPAERQEELVSYLKQTMEGSPLDDGTGRQESQSRAIILFSGDELLTHALMTVCKKDGILVFSVSQQADIDRVVDQCQKMRILPVLVVDVPDNSGTGLSDGDIEALRHYVRGRYPLITFLQLTPPGDYRYAMRCMRDGVRTVFPKPDRLVGRETFVEDMTLFLGSFRSLARYIFNDLNVSATDTLRTLKEKVAALRLIDDVSDISSFLLKAVSLSFGRSIFFSVTGSVLAAESASGLNLKQGTDRKQQPLPSVPLGAFSVFDEVVETGQVFFGECADEVLQDHLFRKIGAPLRRIVFILPLKVSGQVQSLIYADFGEKEISPVSVDTFEVLALEAGLIRENALYRKQLLKTSKKQ